MLGGCLPLLVSTLVFETMSVTEHRFYWLAYTLHGSQLWGYRYFPFYNGYCLLMQQALYPPSHLPHITGSLLTE